MRPLARLTPAFALFMLLVAGCGPEPHPSSPADDAPRVIRAVLDWQPRMAVLPLDAFWVAYDAERAALYKVWPGGVDFDGPVYTTAHGPQPISLGDAYLVSPDRMPWRLVTAAGETTPEVHYRGHRLVDGVPVLQYDLATAGGVRIALTEAPSYEDADGQPRLVRVFTTEGVPAGTSVVLDVHLNSLAAPGSYETDGTFAAAPTGAPAIQDGQLTLNANGTTRFAVTFSEAPTVPAAPPVADADKPEGLVRIEQSDCQACHNAQVKTVGPAYVDIAARYPATDANVAMLATRIREGSSGQWTEMVGPALMTPHPDLQPADAEAMVRYILSLAEAEPGPEPGQDPDNPLVNHGPTYPLYTPDPAAPDGQGMAVNVYRLSRPHTAMPEIGPDQAPVYSGVVPAVHWPDADAFGDLVEYFYVNGRATLQVPRTTNYVFRLISDDGSTLWIDGQEVIDNDGDHGPRAIDGEVYLEEGPHTLELHYFQSGGGLGASLQWIAHGEDAFTVIPPEAFTYDAADLKEARPYEPPPETAPEGIAGDAQPLRGVHPSFRVETIRPDDFEPKVGGLGFLPDGRLVVSTWDPEGSVYAVGNLDAADRNDITVTRIASGLLEPLGLTVVDGEIYVLQKHELTHLIDHDGDGLTDEYRTVADGWGATANFHEFAFGLVYHEGHFYATLATAILPGGASASPQNPDRGKVVRIAPDGTVTFIAHGLRTPNGIGVGHDDALFVADNQGDWLPSSKIVHVREGAFFGNRSVDPEGTASLTEAPPVVWLPQDEIGNSPSTPLGLDVGPYEGQMIHGEVTHGGLKRVFVEEVNGQLQGAVFRFTQGLEAGVNRIAWGPDGRLYIGGIGNPGNWSHYGTNWYGLQRMTYTGDPVFEMLAVRVRPGGLEIEFTEPLAEGTGTTAADYAVRQWRYVPTEEYGGPKVDDQPLAVQEVDVSEDRTRVLLTIPGLQAGHVVYLRLNAALESAGGRTPWSTEAWYTLNQRPD